MDKKEKVNLAAVDLAETLPLMARNIFKFAEQGPPREITRSEGEVLMCIANCRKCTATELSQILHRPKSNLSSIIDKLVSDGLVSRNDDPNDRRIIKIILTPEGEKMVMVIKAHIQGNMAIMLNYLEEEEVTEFHEAIKTIRKLVQKITKVRSN